MRIVHFSDVHVGVENYGPIDPDTGLSARLGDFLATFDEVVDYAISERADLALFAGDAYKSRNPNQTHQREFAARVAKLANAGIPVFLLTGNHDMPLTAGPATALEIFDTLGVRMVHIGERLGVHEVNTPSGPIQIVAVPVDSPQPVPGVRRAARAVAGRDKPTHPGTADEWHTDAR